MIFGKKPLRIHLVCMIAALLPLLWAFAPAHKAPAHDFHVSITQIDYNQGNRSLEIAVKLFTDDLENALETLGAPRLHLGTEMEHEETNDFLGRYLENRLKFKVDGVEKPFRFLGKEVENDVTWSYLEITDISGLAELEVTNRLLTEVFDDQTNLVHINKGDQTKSLMLSKDFARDKVSF